MDEQSIRASIRKAFAGVPYPADGKIGKSEAHDDHIKVAQWFQGRDWHDLTIGELWPPSLYSMTPQAIHYFIPAFLIAATEAASGDISSTLVNFLTPPWTQPYFHTEESFRSCFENFTPAQKQAIKAFLEWDAQQITKFDDEPVDQSAANALHDYWGQF